MVSDRDGEGFHAFDQSVIDSGQLDAQVAHRASITGESQRGAIEHDRSRASVIRDSGVDRGNKVSVVG